MVADLRNVRNAAPARCKHCGERNPSDAADGFCCSGCEAAYAAIHACGLDAYYRFRDTLDDRTPAKRTGRSYSEYDDSVFRTLYVRRVGELESVELFLPTVHCAACVWLVERLPRLCPGVVESRLDLRRAIVRLTWDPARVSLSRLARALDSIGYPPHPARDAQNRQARSAEDRRQLVRLAVAAACAANVMLFATALYAGLFDAMAHAHQQYFRWISMILTVVSLVWPGRVFFASAWAAIRSRTAHIDVPITLALAAGGVWSVVSTIRGHGEIYFDTVSVLVFALLAGRFFQARQQRSAGDALEMLFALTPSSARRVTPQETAEVPIEALAVGDVIEVRPGESIPADCEVMTGETTVDQSLLTGESRPIEIGPGDHLPAGAVNLSGVVRLRATAVGETTRVGKLMRMVEEAARRKAPIVRFADRASSWFTVGMVLLAALTFAGWMRVSAPSAIEHAVALLVVTCPCALGLATPLVMSMALGRAARRGMLIKGGDVIQRLSCSPAGAARGTIFLDKTGTITEGRLAVVRWSGAEWAKPYVAALERFANHPIAAALARDLPSIEHLEVADVVHAVGGGISGVVGGRSVIVGSPRFVRRAVGALEDLMSIRGKAIVEDGFTPVAVAIDGEVVAFAGLGDRIRDDSRATVDRLRSEGWAVRVLSGDHPAVVIAAGRALGLADEDCLGGLSPEEKARIVREAAGVSRGCGDPPVIMVGDGVNDAAALASASVGIAVHGGAEASLAAADVYLSKPGLAPIAELLASSRRTMNVIRRVLGVSIFYNATAGALAVVGLVGPLLAALVMPVSSISGLAMAMSGRTFDAGGGR